MKQLRRGDKRSSLRLRTVSLAGRRTTVRLEAAMWDALQEIAERKGNSLNELLTHIERTANHESSFAASLRSYAIRFFRSGTSGCC